MEWWAWALIIAGVVLIGVIKIAFFKSLKKRQSRKQKIMDEE